MTELQIRGDHEVVYGVSSACRIANFMINRREACRYPNAVSGRERHFRAL
jgi:hypothetical protein